MCCLIPGMDLVRLTGPGEDKQDGARLHCPFCHEASRTSKFVVDGSESSLVRCIGKQRRRQPPRLASPRFNWPNRAVRTKSSKLYVEASRSTKEIHNT
mmetsp:Transcript_18338/g.32439  ORF Transcript_18338/g.32439 Transcript_18338/m.32439 type:complete len:98 (-) Transcript_18338:309-602(-)